MSMTETRAVQTVQSSKDGVGGEENNKLAFKAQDLTVPENHSPNHKSSCAQADKP